MNYNDAKASLTDAFSVKYNKKRYTGEVRCNYPYDAEFFLSNSELVEGWDKLKIKFGRGIRNVTLKIIVDDTKIHGIGPIEVLGDISNKVVVDVSNVTDMDIFHEWLRWDSRVNHFSSIDVVDSHSRINWYEIANLRLDYNAMTVTPWGIEDSEYVSKFINDSRDEILSCIGYSCSLDHRIDFAGYEELCSLVRSDAPVELIKAYGLDCYRWHDRYFDGRPYPWGSEDDVDYDEENYDYEDEPWIFYPKFWKAFSFFCLYDDKFVDSAMMLLLHSLADKEYSSYSSEDEIPSAPGEDELFEDFKVWTDLRGGMSRDKLAVSSYCCIGRLDFNRLAAIG